MAAALALMLAGQAAAQSFTTVYTFTGGSGGGYPHGLNLSGNTLYGAAGDDGVSAPWGTVFAVNTDGTGFTPLYNFTDGSDGSRPGPVVLSGNTLYGTAESGGSGGAGTVFAINTDGTGFTNLYNFTATTGSPPIN